MMDILRDISGLLIITWKNYHDLLGNEENIKKWGSLYEEFNYSKSI
jgi:hypothetical protein